MQSKKFPSFDTARAYLEERGRLEFFGRIGDRAEIFVYNLHTHDGRLFRLFVYEDGKVEVIE